MVCDNKVRTGITLEKKDKEDLEKIAAAQNRSFNNLMVTVLKQFLQEWKEQHKDN